MTNDTYQRQTGGARAQVLATRRAEDRNDTPGRPGRPFHRSTWSAYMAGLVGGAAAPARLRNA